MVEIVFCLRALKDIVLLVASTIFDWRCVMKINLKAGFAAVLGMLLFSAYSQAAVYRWNLDTYAFLDFDSSTNDFRLYDNTANTGLSGGDGINGLTFSFYNSVILSTTVGSFSSFWDTANGSVYKPLTLLGSVNGTQTIYSYNTATNQDINELKDGQSASFNFGAVDFSNIAEIGYRLNTNSAANVNSGSIAEATLVGQVPEPQTTLMLALGLGVLCFVARRRKHV